MNLDLAKAGLDALYSLWKLISFIVVPLTVSITWPMVVPPPQPDACPVLDTHRSIGIAGHLIRPAPGGPYLPRYAPYTGPEL